MLRRITNDSTSSFTLDEVAQELRYFEKHVSETFDSDSEQLVGFEYACELFGGKLEEKNKELEKELSTKECDCLIDIPHPDMWDTITVSNINNDIRIKRESVLKEIQRTGVSSSVRNDKIKSLELNNKAFFFKYFDGFKFCPNCGKKLDYDLIIK